MSKEIIETIFARRSIRKYTTELVESNKIDTMLKAAMAAPSASNRKPWHFIVITDRQALDTLGKVHPYGKMLHEAPLCIAVCGDQNISQTQWVQDCSAATENLLLAATALGLGAVWLGVYPSKERVSSVRKVLDIPKHITPLNLISIGLPAEDKEPRTQYDKQRIHSNHW